MRNPTKMDLYAMPQSSLVDAVDKLTQTNSRLVEALRPMIEGTAFITDAQVEKARALLREIDRRP